MAIKVSSNKRSVQRMEQEEPHYFPSIKKARSNGTVSMRRKRYAQEVSLVTPTNSYMTEKTNYISPITKKPRVVPLNQEYTTCSSTKRKCDKMTSMHHSEYPSPIKKRNFIIMDLNQTNNKRKIDDGSPHLPIPKKPRSTNKSRSVPTGYIIAYFITTDATEAVFGKYRVETVTLTPHICTEVMIFYSVAELIFKSLYHSPYLIEQQVSMVPYFIMNKDGGIMIIMKNKNSRVATWQRYHIIPQYVEPKERHPKTKINNKNIQNDKTIYKTKTKNNKTKQINAEQKMKPKTKTLKIKNKFHKMTFYSI